MKVLKLTLKKKWFDMILSGEKKEEYREIKEYWRTRLATEKYQWVNMSSVIKCATPNDFFEHYTHVEFTNGYGTDKPRILLKCNGFYKGEGQENWGAEKDTEYFVIKLGEIIEKHNIK